MDWSRWIRSYSDKVHGARKKKKNILTEEQLQKKLEMEERRKAQINRVADEQKRNVVEKILNVDWE